MPPLTIFLLSVSMSADAFAVSVGRGTAVAHPKLGDALRTGAVFGIVEAITPFLGWLAGVAANDWVAHLDHWIAFALLAGVGLHMIYGAVHERPHGEPRPAKGNARFLLVATAVGTSLDAMAVGLSLAFLDVDLPGILLISLAIGLATFVMSTSGILLGKVIGDRFGKTAEILAGAVLIGIGAMILVEHLHG